jgi:hypothetical protein
MENKGKNNLSIRTRRGTIVGKENLKVLITKYYKNLFGALAKKNTMQEDVIVDIPQLSSEENNILIADFTGEEIFEAIFQMEHNKASGLDRFPVEFYQTSWEVIKKI